VNGALDQVPFALSLALNDAAKDTRSKLIGETWPRSVVVRNRSFMRAALRTVFASKTNLRVGIFDSLGRGSLALHDKGGVKRARGQLAIPSKRVQARRGGKGVPANLRPRNLARKVVKNGLIFQAQGRGKNSKLVLMYALRAQAKLRADVPFSADFRRFMLQEVERKFPIAMMKAMSTRR
jgi:hypothetical protein